MHASIIRSWRLGGVLEVVLAEDLAALRERVLAEEGDGVGVADALLLDAVVAGERDAGAVAELLHLGAARVGALGQHRLADLLLVVLVDLQLVPPVLVRRRLRLERLLGGAEPAADDLHRRACMMHRPRRSVGRSPLLPLLYISIDLARRKA